MPGPEEPGRVRAEPNCLRGRISYNDGEKCVLESIQALSLLTIMEIVGPALLLAVLIALERLALLGV